jgi:hypothetical protein
MTSTMRAGSANRLRKLGGAEHLAGDANCSVAIQTFPNNTDCYQHIP